jgi:hypothetical protein
VIVALGAAEGGAEPDGGDGADAVGGVLGEVLFGLDAAFGRGAGEAVEGGGGALLAGGVGEQVAGELFAGEDVEGLVGEEGAEDVVAVGPGGEGVIAVEAAGIGVADGVEPEHGLLFGVAGGGEETVDDGFVGFAGGEFGGVGGRPARSR